MTQPLFRLYINKPSRHSEAPLVPWESVIPCAVRHISSTQVTYRQKALKRYMDILSTRYAMNLKLHCKNEKRIATGLPPFAMTKFRLLWLLKMQPALRSCRCSLSLLTAQYIDPKLKKDNFPVKIFPYILTLHVFYNLI